MSRLFNRGYRRENEIVARLQEIKRLQAKGKILPGDRRKYAVEITTLKADLEAERLSIAKASDVFHN